MRLSQRRDKVEAALDTDRRGSWSALDGCQGIGGQGLAISSFWHFQAM